MINLSYKCIVYTLYSELFQHELYLNYLNIFFIEDTNVFILIVKYMYIVLIYAYIYTVLFVTFRSRKFAFIFNTR